MATSLLSLPFEILKDALAYAEVSPITHDVIYYIFSHRLQLDFSSTFSSSGIIQLPDETIMRVLHAHTRATEVRFLALSPTFQQTDQLKYYLDLYWNRMYLLDYAHNPEPAFFSGNYIGHQSGQLESIGYLEPLDHTVHDLLQSYDDPVYGVFIESEPMLPLLAETQNWSAVDIDEPYATCTTCGQTINPQPHPNTLCSSCIDSEAETDQM